MRIKVYLRIPIIWNLMYVYCQNLINQFQVQCEHLQVQTGLITKTNLYSEIILNSQNSEKLLDK